MQVAQDRASWRVLEEDFVHDVDPNLEVDYSRVQTNLARTPFPFFYVLWCSLWRIFSGRGRRIDHCHYFHCTDGVDGLYIE